MNTEPYVIIVHTTLQSRFKIIENNFY